MVGLVGRLIPLRILRCEIYAMKHFLGSGVDISGRFSMLRLKNLPLACRLKGL